MAEDKWVEAFGMVHAAACPDKEVRTDNPLGMAEEVVAEIKRLNQWVSDLHANMYVNCVYCGHRYGPEDEVPASMAEVLKKHVEQCPKHPMAKLKAIVDDLAKAHATGGFIELDADLARELAEAAQGEAQ